MYGVSGYYEVEGYDFGGEVGFVPDEAVGAVCNVMGISHPADVGARRVRRRQVRNSGRAATLATNQARAAIARAQVASAASAQNQVAMTMGTNLVSSSQRQRPLPLGSVVVPAAGSATLTARVQKPIQGMRLILDFSSAAGAVVSGELSVQSIKVGVEEQLASNAGAPITAFQGGTFDQVLEMDPAIVGMDVSILLANANAATAATVRGVIFGTSGR